ncbi:hypothetical protein QLG07_02660, partial [Erwinia sp. V90_4]|nr:hypothetical protein [Erwinia sp. V90_4]
AIKRTLKGIAGGSLAADSSEAVTGAQLYTAKKNAADALGGGAGVGKDGSFTGPSYTVQGATKNNVGDALGTLDTAVSQQGSSLTNISNTVNQLNSGTAGLVTQDAESKAISVAKGRGGDSVDFTGEDGDTKKAIKRTLKGIAGGSLAADSSEAVTGAQLYTAKKNAADALGGGAGVGKDGSFTGPSYTVQGATKNNVGDALGTLDT